MQNKDNSIYFVVLCADEQAGEMVIAIRISKL